MPGFTARIDQITFDATLFSRSMEAACRELMKNAAKYWLIQVINRIPIRTGFLVGSFSGLEEMLGITAPKFGSSLTLRDKSGKFVKRDLSKGYGNALIKHYSGIKNKRIHLLEKQADLEKRIGRLEKRRIEVEEKNPFEGEQRGARKKALQEGAAMEQAAQEKAHIERAQKHNARIDARIKRLNKRYLEVNKSIQKFNRLEKGSHSYVASKESFRGRSDVIAELNDLRKEINKLDAKTKKEQGFHEFNPQVGHEKARFEKRYTDITGEVEPTNAEKIAALRKREKLVKRVEVLGTKLERFQTRAEKKIFAFKEYYKDGVIKVLKTPRSGLQFATPNNEVFGEFDIATRNLLTSLEAQKQARTNFDTRNTGPGEGLFGPTFTAQVNDAFKTSVTANLYKQILQTKSFFSFNFTVNISYYDINDYYRTGRFGQKTMPWGSQAAGQVAFYQYLEHNAPGKLPKITDFVHTSRVTYDGQNFPTELRKDVVT